MADREADMAVAKVGGAGGAGAAAGAAAGAGAGAAVCANAEPATKVIAAEASSAVIRWFILIPLLLFNRPKGRLRQAGQADPGTTVRF